MQKQIQVITIPHYKSGWDKDNLLKDDDNNFKLVNYTRNTNVEDWQAQQLLVLSDDVIELGNQCISKNFKHLYLVTDEDTADIANTLSCFKIIASYPQLEGTLPLSKETIQQWIDNGTPGEGSVDVGNFYTGSYIHKCRTCDKEYVGDKRWYWCKECSEKEIITDSQGNLILGFDKNYEIDLDYPEEELTNEEAKEWCESIKQSYTPKEFLATLKTVPSDNRKKWANDNKHLIVYTEALPTPTDEEIRYKADLFASTNDSEDPDLPYTNFEKTLINYGFQNGYKQALKDIKTT
jgi:hypothetical protein